MEKTAGVIRRSFLCLSIADLKPDDEQLSPLAAIKRVLVGHFTASVFHGCSLHVPNFVEGRLVIRVTRIAQFNSGIRGLDGFPVLAKRLQHIGDIVPGRC